MQETANKTNSPDRAGLSTKLRKNREKYLQLTEKTQKLQEQLLLLERKLWGRKADETLTT
ncbi:MAG: hypothetical protein U0931_31825 [Vulcanimicrobiota bacterium]